LRIVVAHNFYQQAGGEDQVFADETALLESRGHTVTRHTVHNDEVNHLGRITLAGRTIWNRESHRELSELVKRERAEIVHFHNTFPLMSPSVYSAARNAGAAVVQTLHNYRLICPTAICYRDGHVCEDCVTKKIPWPAIVHRCYRSDRSASVVTAAMLAVHHGRGTYANDVDAYIALTEFAKQKFVQAGLPEKKFTVKPNFVSPDPGIGDGSGGYCAFVGRLTESKGISVMLKAWKQIRGDIQLKIAGDGELAPMVRDAAASDSRIHFVGRLPSDQVYDLLGQAAALVFPSVWYEGLPKTILESFAKGTPVIASNLGSMSSLITDGRTGAHFTPGNAADLARTITRLYAGDELHAMRPIAREEFEGLYTGDANYRMLMEVYERILSGGVLAGVEGSGR
jgi:glycosyltransferase involved in cell wall biosynthesis